MDFTNILADRVCECGKTHRSETKKIVMYPGALRELPSVISEMGIYKNIVMICDENTYEVAGKQVENLVSLSQSIILNPYHLHANEKAVYEVQEKMLKNADLLLAVGSGTIHDITRYVAYHANLTFVSVPTAASVDGYVSGVAAMTWHGVKNTMKACAPYAMVADIDIIAEAPMRLTASGVGDMLGKYSALCDWRIGVILTGEYYCEHTVKMVEEALQNVKDSINGLEKKDRGAIMSLMYGLVLSGIAMQHTGISRPASGAEHHISHFIEMTIPQEECDALHGEKVGVGLALVSRLYHSFNSLTNGEIASKINDFKKPSESYIKEKFGSLADEILKENENDCASGTSKELFLSKLPEIRKEINSLPTEKEVISLLRASKACATLEDIGLSEKDMLPELYKTAPNARNRYTLMKLISGMM